MFTYFSLVVSFPFQSIFRMEPDSCAETSTLFCSEFIPAPMDRPTFSYSRWFSKVYLMLVFLLRSLFFRLGCFPLVELFLWEDLQLLVGFTFGIVFRLFLDSLYIEIWLILLRLQSGLVFSLKKQLLFILFIVPPSCCCTAWFVRLRRPLLKL